MMGNIWFISDLHLGHAKCLEFRNDDGSLLREFNSVEEMNGTIVGNWNKVVKTNDRVYVLGDVAWGEENLLWLKAMKGRKTLIKGNHDNLWNIRKFLEVFDDVCGVRPLNVNGFKCVLSHVPIHPDSLGRWGVNIHGHTHGNNVTLDTVMHTSKGNIHKIVPDSRYINVSVEQINYTPISLEEIKERLNAD